MADPLPTPADGERPAPVRPDIWGDGPGGLPVGGPHLDAPAEDPYAAHRLGTGGLDMSKDPDRYDPAADTAVEDPYAAHRLGTGGLDMSQDPDRYDPAADATAVLDPVLDPVPVPRSPLRGLDMSQDPDRYRGGEGQTLPGLLGEGAQEESRDTYTWLAGLLGILLFLAIVTYGSRLLAQ